MNSYLQDILEQPAALQRWLDSTNSMEYTSLRHIHRQLSSGLFRRVVLTGMGSSFHALHSILLPLLNHGIPALMLETSELLRAWENQIDDDMGVAEDFIHWCRRRGWKAARAVTVPRYIVTK